MLDHFVRQEENDRTFFFALQREPVDDFNPQPPRILNLLKYFRTESEHEHARVIFKTLIRDCIIHKHVARSHGFTGSEFKNRRADNETIHAGCSGMEG